MRPHPLVIALFTICISLFVSCERRQTATTTIQISRPSTISQKDILQTLQTEADSSTYIKQIPETDLFKIGLVSKTTEDARQRADIVISKMQIKIQEKYPEAKFVIWSRSE